jgi:hypothetical protein
MADETPQVTATNTAATNAAAEEPGIGQSLLGLADSVLSNSTGQGAAMGGLLGYLLSQYGAPGGVNLGVDMSKASGIAPRTTTLPRSKYVSYSDYGVQNQAPSMTPQMARDFGISGGLTSRLPVSAYSAVPARQNLAPVSFTSAGVGTGAMQNPIVTPRSNNEISPLTGALMGSAIGYLRGNGYFSPTSGGTSGTGGISGGSKPASNVSGALDTLLNAFNKQFNKPSTSGGGNVGPNVPTGSGGEAYWTDDSGKQWAINPDGTTRLVYDPSTGGGSAGGYDPNDFGGEGPVIDDAVYPDPTVDPWQPDTPNLYDDNGNLLGGDYNPLGVDLSYGQNYTDYKNGGMATPLMAEGGEVPHYYTYGTAIDPQQIMQNMAQGGKPSPQGGLHVPTVEGRHDYRSGSRVTGEGDGQSDDIPAMLADGEYVFDADTVAQLGNGSTKAGSDLLDRFREEIRSHKRSAPVNKIPPPAKSPLAYLKAARSKKNG